MTSFEKYRKEIDRFVKENTELRRKLLRDLCFIPAPAGYEEKRAYYCLEFLKSIGADTAYIDDEKNVVYEYNVGKSGATLICAHTDIVFQDMQPMPYVEEPENDSIRCPGIGDDTANVTAVMLIAKFFLENRIRPENGIIFLLDTSEEVGGNGMTYFMNQNRDRIGRVIVYDSVDWKSICDKVVARRDFHVKITTAGGHAQHAFGSPNAIVVASEIIDRIYKITVPRKSRLVATYNVGIIGGGTEKNKIASCCEFDLECRSNYPDVFEELSARIEGCILESDNERQKVEIVSDHIKEGGVNVDEARLNSMIDTAAEVVTAYAGKAPTFCSATTSANIPMSMGIPAICLGSLLGGYIHSTKEYLRISSLEPGLAASIGFVVGIAGV